MEQATPDREAGASKAGQWLASSVAWTFGCMGGWLCLAHVLVVNQSYINPSLHTVLLFLGLLVAHSLMWQKAVASAWKLELKAGKPSSLKRLIALWRLLLVPFQLACLVLGLLGLALGEFGSWEPWF